MRKVLTLALMILSEHVIGQTFIRLRDGAIIPDSTASLTRRTVENVEKGILVTYELGYAQIIPDGSYPNASIVRINRFGLNGEIEAPATPIKIDRFSVPSRDTKVILLDSTYIIPTYIFP